MRTLAKLMMFALAMSVATPALAQHNKLVATTPTKKKTPPPTKQDAVRIETAQVPGYKQDRALLRNTSAELFRAARVAREVDTPAARRAHLSKLTKLQKDVDLALTRQSRRLGGTTMAGKQRQAFTLVQSMRAANTQVGKQLSQADAAMKRGDARGFTGAIAGAERSLQTLQDRARTFALLEPVIHR